MGENRVCEILGIEYPIIEGGLAYVGNGSLAAAVSNGGGLGVVGSAGRSVEDFREQIKIAADQTDHPFGVNLPISRHSDSSKYVEVILENKHLIKAVSISAGNPRPFIPVFKEAGMRVMVLTSTALHSLKAEEAGADIIICEGFEAGGHNGPAELTLFSLIPQAVKAVSVPVVAAGGISNGQGILAAFVLGAEGVQLGTRFVATKECQAHDEYKKLLVESSDDATVVMERSIGRVCRVLKGPFVQEILELEKNNPGIEAMLPYIKGTNNKIAIQKKLEKTKQIAPRSKRSDYLLSGLVQCGHCGSRMIGTHLRSTKGGETVYYPRYICSSYQKKGLCFNHWIHANVIEPYILGKLDEFITGAPIPIYGYVETSTHQQRTREELSQAKRILKSIDEKSERQLQAFEAGAIDLTELKEAKERLRLEKAELVEKIKSLEGLLEGLMSEKDIQNFIHLKAKGLKDSLDSSVFEVQQNALREILHGVKVFDSQAIQFSILL